MDDLGQLVASVEATRQQLKAAQRVIRTSLQFVTDLQEQLDAIAIAQPGGKAYGSNGHATQNGKVRFEVSDLSSSLG